MWLQQASPEKLAVVIEYCSALKMISGPDGEIHHANTAFCEWSQYTLRELIKIGWKELSVDGASMDADLEAVNDMVSGYTQKYSVQKQYRTKSGSAVWGTLSVVRYPATGPVEFFSCTFDPLKNGSAAAFAHAVEFSTKLERRFTEMTAEIQTITRQTEEDRFVLSLSKMMIKYTKVVVGILVFLAMMTGLTKTIQFLQQMGIMPIPVQVEKIEAGVTTKKKLIAVYDETGSGPFLRLVANKDK